MRQNPLSTNNSALTKPHFSCKVYQCYFSYLKKNYPDLNIAKICLEAGLSYEYLSNQNNWVSVVFDQKFTQLLIKRTGERNLSYLAGSQAISKESLGTFVAFIVKHALSIKSIYEHLPGLTTAFSKVTKVEIQRSKPGHITLAFRPVVENLSKLEFVALSKNLSNIYQNTVAHYIAIPSVQGLPFATISDERLDESSQSWEIDISYKSKSTLEARVILVFPMIIGLCIYLALLGANVESPNAEFLSSLVVAIGLLTLTHYRYRRIQNGFEEAMGSLDELDQRYRELHIANTEIYKISKAYQKFVPAKTLALLDKASIVDVQYGDYIQKDMAILFADLRNFSAIASKMPAVDTFRFLNGHLNRIAPSIRKNQGFIDKYIGDGIMAIFPESPQNCLNAAIDMVRVLRVYNERRHRRGLAPTHIGVGIHTGEMAFGTLGHPEQMQTTVVADGVNKAFRFQDYCKEYQATIITSHEAINVVDTSTLTYRFLATVRLKGSDERARIYEVLDGVDAKQLTLYQMTTQLFEEGVLAFEASQFKAAESLFNKVLEQNPRDLAALRYLEKVAVGIVRLQEAS